MVYCCSSATLGSPLMVCMPPAACHVEPEVSSALSISSTSFQPAFVRWYRTLTPTTPPPITATCTCVLIDAFRSFHCECDRLVSCHVAPRGALGGHFPSQFSLMHGRLKNWKLRDAGEGPQAPGDCQIAR